MDIETLAKEQTNSAQPEVNNVVSQPQGIQAEPAVTQQQAPAKLPDSIPYTRFSEVVHQRNALQSEIENMKAQLANQSAPQAVNTADYSNVKDVNDLMGVVRSEIRSELEQAYETKVKPISEYVGQSALVANVEAYYARNPEAAQLRRNIDGYFDTLSPQYQNFVKDSLRNGDTTVLDNLYYTVATQARNNVQATVNQNVQQNSYQAMSPQNYRTIRNVQPGFRDKLDRATNSTLAGDPRSDQVWEDVMKDVFKNSVKD